MDGTGHTDPILPLLHLFHELNFINSYLPGVLKIQQYKHMISLSSWIHVLLGETDDKWINTQINLLRYVLQEKHPGIAEKSK